MQRNGVQGESERGRVKIQRYAREKKGMVQSSMEMRE